MIEKLLKHPLAFGGIIMVGGSMAANIVNYIYHLLMGRILGPVDYGILASLYSVLYLTGVVPTSASVSIVKFISSAKDSEQYSVYASINKFIIKISLVLSLLLLLGSSLISSFLHIDNIWTITLLAPILFLLLVTLVNQATSQGILKFVGNVGPIIISSLAKFVLGLLLVYLGWSVFGAMVGVLLGSVLSYYYSYWFIKKVLPKGRIKKFDLKPFFSYSLPVLIQAFAFTSIFTVDVLLAKHFLDPFSAGIYAALSTLGKIIFFATSPITATMFPVVSRRRSQNQGYIKIFLASLAISSAIALLVTLFYWLFPNVAIGVLYGKDYLSAKTDLVWMGLFMVFYTLSNLLVNFYLSIGKIKVVVIPLVAAVVQASIIWLKHGSVTQIVTISLTVSMLMFICLAGYTGYNLYYETKNR